MLNYKTRRFLKKNMQSSTYTSINIAAYLYLIFLMLNRKTCFSFLVFKIKLDAKKPNFL